MRFEVKYRNGQDPMEALMRTLKVLKRKTSGNLKLVRTRQRGFVKPSAILHQKIRDILHKRKIKKSGKNKKWKN